VNSGWSRPYLAIIAALISALGIFSAVKGSPGIAFIKKKVIVITKKIVIAAEKILFKT
jgi:hypothetical protein